MKKIIKTPLAIALGSLAILVSQPSYADISNYVRLDLGYAVPLKLKDATRDFYSKAGKTSGATSVSIGAGMSLTPSFRTDAVINYKGCFNYKNTGTSGETVYQENQQISALSMMVNAYYDIQLSKRVTPYVMAGFGYARIKASDYKYILARVTAYPGKTSNNIAWTVGLGATVKLVANIDLDISYKFIDLGKIRTSSKEEVGSPGLARPQIKQFTSKLRSNEFMAGFRYTF
jgi:opacity protein-like surface antigen